MGGLSPIKFFKGMMPAIMMAFSSASSVGTLPLNMECSEKLGADKEVASFVLPLGATINMDGTAIYQGVCAVFIASCFGISLSFSQMLTIVLTATLASIGTAGVPGAGMVMLAMVLQSVGLPVEGIALVADIDRIFDMGRTVVNITGDASCALYYMLNRDANLFREVRLTNWAPVVLGIVIVGLEVGFIYAFRAGWQVGTTQIITSAVVAVLLIFVGYLLYHEAITWNKIAGIIICLAGLVLINIR